MTDSTVPDPVDQSYGQPAGKNSSQCLWVGMHPRANRSQKSSLPDESNVRSARLIGEDLSHGNSCIWSQGLRNPPPSTTKQSNIFFKKKHPRKRDHSGQGHAGNFLHFNLMMSLSHSTPQHRRTTWPGVLPARILTSLDSSGSFGPQTGEPLAGGRAGDHHLSRQVFWLSPDLSHG